jgi:hypothetical protein
MALRRKLLQNVGAGGVGAGLAPLAADEPEIVEEYLAELLGRADVEAATGEAVYFRLQRGHLLRELAGEA